MKEKIKTILLQNPNITLPEAARVLGRDPQGDKNFRIAYWQARALLIEELTGKTLRAILDGGPKDNIDEGHTVDTDSIDSKIYSTERMVFDKETGELLEHTEDRYKVVSIEPNYIKVYIDAMSYFITAEEQGMETNLLFEMAKRMTYANDAAPNQVAMIGLIKKGIAKQLNTTVGSLDVVLTRLIKKDLVRRIDRGVYELNPIIFAKGDWSSIRKIQMEWSEEGIKTKFEMEQ